MSYIGTEPKDIRSFGRTKFDYTATQGQTAFTGADDDGKVLAFTTGQIEVFVNGILMDESDFTTTGTGTVTLASAANLNDVISIVSFESNIPDNDYVPASGGTFTGNVTHSGTVTNNGNVGISTTPTAKLHINTGTSTDDFDQVLIEGSSSGGSSNPEITLLRNDSSPADFDYLGGINFYGKNSADENIKYAQINGRALDVSDSTEDGALYFFTEGGGILRETALLSNGDSRLRTNNLKILSYSTGGENNAGTTLALIRYDSTVASGNVLGTMGFGHTDGDPDFPSQTPQQLPASIRAVAAETAGSGDDGANMEFYTKPINADKDVSSTLNMKIDASGIVTTPNQPNFRVKGNTGGWQSISSASEQTVLFGDEQWDIGSNFDTSNGRFTAPVAGKYFFHFHAYVRQAGQNDSTDYGTSRIYKNGSLYSGATNIFGYNNLGDSDQIAPLTTIMDMAANDYATCVVRANSGSTEFYQPNCLFMGYLIG